MASKDLVLITDGIMRHGEIGASELEDIKKVLTIPLDSDSAEELATMAYIADPDCICKEFCEFFAEQMADFLVNEEGELTKEKSDFLFSVNLDEDLERLSALLYRRIKSKAKKIYPDVQRIMDDLAI